MTNPVTKALTVQQPWAWATIFGGKDIENRTQAWKYRGPLAIHAGARWSDRGDAAMVDLAQPARYMRMNPPELAIERSVILGVIDLVDVHQESPSGERCCSSRWAEFSSGPFNRSPYAVLGRPIWHLVLANPRPLPNPIPAVGALGLWNLRSDLAALLEQELADG